MQPGERVELHRAASGVDLWSLIESAQYARIVLHELPADRAEALLIADFVDSLSVVIEAWSEIAQSNAAPMLRELDAGLAELARAGLFLHGLCVERSVQIERDATTQLPLAIIHIGHNPDERVTVDIPTELNVALPEDESSSES
jgi:hypothetical protein